MADWTHVGKALRLRHCLEDPALTEPKRFRYTRKVEARYPSGKGEVCKTFMRGFDSHPRLHQIPNKNAAFWRVLSRLCQDCASTRFERAAKADAFQGNGPLQQVYGERIAEEVWVLVRNLGGFEYLAIRLRQTDAAACTFESPNPEVDPLADAVLPNSQKTAVGSQAESVSRGLRLEFLRMRNTNGGKTASSAIPTTRFAAYLVQPATDLIFRLDPVGGVFGKYFVFPAVDTAKGKDVPLGLSGLHRKTPDSAGTGAFDCTIR